jgi:POT family proton-dependent oligopeptide transporter
MHSYYFKEFISFRSLFLAECFERLSFFGLKAMLVLWLTKGLSLEDETSFLTYGAFFALTYMTPVIGGWFCDHLWGSRRTLKLGVTLEILGYILLALASVDFIYLGLGFIAFGAGFFKTAMMNLLGQAYKDFPHRRDAGFSVFYLTINVSGFLGPFICAALGETYGWHYGFFLCAGSALLSLIFFLKGSGFLKKVSQDISDPIF